MANTNPLAKTTGQKAQGPTMTRGVGLKESEWQELAEIAADLGKTPHAIAAYGLRYFLRQYRNGAIKAEPKPTLPEV